VSLTIDRVAFRQALIDASQALIDSKRELGRLDAAGGDGDLGVTLETGFAAARHHLEQNEQEGIDTQIRTVGEILCREAPSTMGTLFGTALTVASQSLTSESLDGSSLVEFLEHLADEIAALGQVGEGQRTALDALRPAARAARSAHDASGGSIEKVMRAACTAAAAGADATASMPAVVGRARWTAERAAGSVDAGARACAIWLCALQLGLDQ